MKKTAHTYVPFNILWLEGRMDNTLPNLGQSDEPTVS